MAGTKAGGLKAAKTNIEKYGKDFYKKISRKASHPGTGGFSSFKVGKDGLTGWQRAKIAGAKGGKISKRGPAKKKPASSEPKGEYMAKKWRAEIENYERIYG